MTESPRITIYTDGGSEPNPGPGGWAALLIDEASGQQRELSGSDPDTTNNRMELTAAIEALRALKGPSAVTLYTDSEYLKNGITQWLPGWVRKGWLTSKKEPVKNSDLWQALHAETRRHTIAWQWVRGHAGNAYNERVDQLATAARQGVNPPPAAILSPALADPTPTPDFEIALRVWVQRSGGPGGFAFRFAGSDPTSPRTTHTGRESATTANRLLLRAALEALRALPPGGIARVYCPDDYLFKGMTEWIERWQVRGWRTSANKPVEHRDLWEALLAEASTRRVLWAPEPTPAPDLARGLVKLAQDSAGL